MTREPTTLEWIRTHGWNADEFPTIRHGREWLSILSVERSPDSTRFDVLTADLRWLSKPTKAEVRFA